MSSPRFPIVPDNKVQCPANVPDNEEHSQSSAETIIITTITYFAYAKDMDVTYIDKLFNQLGNNAKTLGIARLSGHQWLIDSSSGFPIIVPSGEEHSVWGVVYELELLPEGLNTFQSKAAKRGLLTAEVEVQLYQLAKGDGLGTEFTPIAIDSTPTHTLNVTAMIGTLVPGEELSTDTRKLEGSKREKLNAGIMWGSYLGLPTEWKEKLRKHVDKNIDESGYWPGSAQFFEQTQRNVQRDGKMKAVPNEGEWTGPGSLKQDVRKSARKGKGRTTQSDDEDDEGTITGGAKGKKRGVEDGQDEARVKRVRQEKADRELARNMAPRRVSIRNLTDAQIAELEAEDEAEAEELARRLEESAAREQSSRKRAPASGMSAKKGLDEDEVEDDDGEDGGGDEDMGGMGDMRKETLKEKPTTREVNGKVQIKQGAVWRNADKITKRKKSATKKKR